MKKIHVCRSTVDHFLACLLAASLLFNALNVVAETTASKNNTTPKIVSIANPTQNYGVQIGDQLARKLVLDVPLPYKINSDALPKKFSKINGIELVNININADTKKNHTLYTVQLRYQVFSNASTPVVMQLPAVKLMLSGGEKPSAIDFPAWGFWFSPLVTGGIETAQKNLQPAFAPPLVEMAAHQMRLAVFLTLLFVSVLALIYVNADGQWLPWMGGAFAKAHRKIKRLNKSAVSKTVVEEKQAFVYLHQAFNQHFGANIFARDIEHFVLLRPSFKKVKADIEQFFNASNQSLYALDMPHSEKSIAHLVQLSKKLRDCERGI